MSETIPPTHGSGSGDDSWPEIRLGAPTPMGEYSGVTPPSLESLSGHVTAGEGLVLEPEIARRVEELILDQRVRAAAQTILAAEGAGSPSMTEQQRMLVRANRVLKQTTGVQNPGYPSVREAPRETTDTTGTQQPTPKADKVTYVQSAAKAVYTEIERLDPWNDKATAPASAASAIEGYGEKHRGRRPQVGLPFEPSVINGKVYDPRIKRDEKLQKNMLEIVNGGSSTPWQRWRGLAMTDRMSKVIEMQEEIKGLTGLYGPLLRSRGVEDLGNKQAVNALLKNSSMTVAEKRNMRSASARVRKLRKQKEGIMHYLIAKGKISNTPPADIINE